MADQNEHKADKHNAINAVDAYDGHSSKKPITEVYPVGMFNKAPDKDDAVYRQVNADNTVGPFSINAKQFREFKATHSAEKLEELVERGALRPTTALCIKSGQFDSFLNTLESGQKPAAETVQRFLPGDLQRVIETERLEKK